MRWKRSTALWMITPLFLGACVQPASHQCSNSSRWCPSNAVCSPQGDECLTCGDGLLDPGELCDDNNNEGGDGCSADCKSTEECGDRQVNRSIGEVCDDDTLRQTTCPHGRATCAACAPGCRSMRVLTGPYCGDGDAGVNHGVDTDAGEVCDDGNAINETSCPYGSPTCQTCNSTCSGLLSPDGGGYCGDGLTQPSHEQCDDGNALDCGLCSSSCGQLRQITRATGTIQAAQESAIAEGEIVTLNDGFVERTWEVDRGNGVDAGHLPILIAGGDSASAVAAHMADAFRDAGQRFAVSSVGDSVYITAQQPGSAGNQPIGHFPLGSALVFSGMAGGAGRDCVTGTGCTSNDDCSSRTCDAGVCGP